MTDSGIAANKALALAFVDAINERDLPALERVCHPDFVWFTAVVGADDANALRPLQSKTLHGTNLPHWKPRLARSEALTVFRSLFEGRAGEAHQAASGAPLAATAPPAEEGMGDFHIDVLNAIGEGDQVMLEAESNQFNPVNGRTYNNFYSYVFAMADGAIVLFKEYQDTLHVYDYLAD